MVLNFAREGERLSDAAFRARIRRYYELLRAGIEQRLACAQAVAEIDYFGRMRLAA